MVIAPFCFSTEHHWTALTPFWLSPDNVHNAHIIQWNLVITRSLGPWKLPCYNQVSHYIRVKKQRNIKSWDQHLVIKGFYYIRPLYNEVPLYLYLMLFKAQFEAVNMCFIYWSNLKRMDKQFYFPYWEMYVAWRARVNWATSVQCHCYVMLR